MRRGVALVQALVVVAALAALALVLSQRADGAMHRLQTRFEADQLGLYLESGTDLLRATLPQESVHPGQSWATPRDDVMIGEAILAWSVVDLQGRFNLGWLRDGPEARAGLERLLTQAGLGDSARAEVLAAVSAAVLPDWSLPEALLATVSPETRRSLRPVLPLLTVLPGDRRANLHTLAPEVLAALAPGLTLAQRQEVLAVVSEAPGAVLDELLPRIGEVLGDEVRAMLAAMPLGTGSNSFLIHLEARLDTRRLRRSGVVDTAEAGNGMAAPLRLVWTPVE